MFEALFDALEAAMDRIARIEHRVANLNPVGPVVERSLEKGVRIRLGGTDENPFLSPWIKPPAWAGVNSYLPDVGEQVMVHSHGGDWTQATLQPLTHTKDKPDPATSEDETVIFNKGKIRLTANHKDNTVTFTVDKASTKWEGAKISHTVDGNSTTYEKDKITFPDGSKVRHGDRNIGKDHVHGGVFKGFDKTEDPEE